MKKSATVRPFLKFLNFFILFAFDYLVKMMKNGSSQFFYLFFIYFLYVNLEKRPKMAKNDHFLI